MTTRDHLIYHLQDRYGLIRDMLPLVNEALHDSGSEAMRQLLHTQRESQRAELETLERALNILGAQYKMERNPVAPGIREAAQRFRHQMNPTVDQQDIHALLGLLAVAHFVLGAYQGDLELARALGEQDVVTLLEENMQRTAVGAETLHSAARNLIDEVNRRETRRAA